MLFVEHLGRSHHEQTVTNCRMGHQEPPQTKRYQNLINIQTTAVTTGATSFYMKGSKLKMYKSLGLKARTNLAEFRARYSPTFNASWLNKGRQCEFKKTSRFVFLVWRAASKTIRPMRLGAFAHVSEAAEVTVKHNLGMLKHQNSLAEHTYVTTKKIYAK